MDRRPDHLPDLPPARPPHSPPRNADPGGGPDHASGSLPPWPSLGLGSDSGPRRDRAWAPAAPELPGTEDLPDRPPSRMRRGVLLATVIGLGLLLILAAVGLLWSGVIGGPAGAPGPGRIASPAGQAPAGTGAAIATNEPRSVAGAATSPTARPPSAAIASPVGPAIAAAPVATTAAGPPILIAAGTGAVDGVGARAIAAAVQQTLIAAGAGRAVEVAGPARATDAAIVVDTAPPDQGFTTSAVAIAPLAVVTSPRLPLFGVSRDQADQLLKGGIADWQTVGAGIHLKVEPLAVGGPATPSATPPVATATEYEALVQGLDQHRGGVALVPLALVDFRVNVLAVDGVDPLRGGDLSRYPYADRLYVGVRTTDAAALKPAIDAALTRLGLPRTTPKPTTVGLVGDVTPGRAVNQKMVERGDFTRPFARVAPTLAAYDLSFANLNGVLSATIPPPDNQPGAAAVADPRLIDGLKRAGIDGVVLANSGAMGFGAQGLTDTTTALRQAGMPYVGAGATLDEARKPHVFDVNGTKVALLAINGVSANPDKSLPGVTGADQAATASAPGTNPFVADQYLADIRAAATQADVVIPYFSMGVADKETPPQWVIAAARAAIDAGATIVIASHPHLIQGMEVYKGKPIVYSLGNCVSDQMFSVEVRQGAILEVTLRGKQIAGLRLHGIEIEDFNQPRLMTGDEQAAFLDRFWRLTDRLAGTG